MTSEKLTPTTPNHRIRPSVRTHLVRTGLAGLALTSAACLPQPSDFFGLEETPTVRVYGDSLTAHLEHRLPVENPVFDREQQYLTEAFNERGYQADIVAEIGASTTDLATLDMSVVEPADIEIIALGTNDNHVDPVTGLPAVSFEQAQINLNNHLELLTPQCVVFVGNAETTAWGLHQTAAVWNDHLEQTARQRNESGQGQTIFVDWAEQVRANPTYVDPVDQVHMLPDGHNAYMAVMLDAADACVLN